ncbi:unnamed protein product [Sphenostylis stenocarpa]|uniref:Cation/H(+) antiporter C-terminal domain-containing protein n=1 Tax=Sphenostylis stenocarpa TaxID=92480 RepID=A0AA86S373_9FABA|nr:unnamed protein product [Sphenostylis stenocarpa]
MAEHPGIFLNVVKVVTPPGTSLAFGARLVGVSSNKYRKTVDAVDDNNYADKKQDDELWSKFLSACNNNQESMKYEEKLVQSKGDIETTLKDMKRSNLILVGRMPSVAPLGSQSDCPELGPVGSFLASSDYSTVTSVMVIQQYNPSTDIHPLVMEESDFPEMSDTPRNLTLGKVKDGEESRKNVQQGSPYGATSVTDTISKLDINALEVVTCNLPESLIDVFLEEVAKSLES